MLDLVHRRTGRQKQANFMRCYRSGEPALGRDRVSPYETDGLVRAAGWLHRSNRFVIKEFLHFILGISAHRCHLTVIL